MDTKLINFVNEWLVAAAEKIPDYKLVCAIVTPEDELGLMHNLTNRDDAPAILRRLADQIERQRKKAVH